MTPAPAYAGGLSRPPLASAAAWVACLRRWEREQVRQLHRANGRIKVLRELIAHARDAVKIIDVRNLSEIARECGTGRRAVRRRIAELEAAGLVVRCFKAGRRSCHGWPTSVYVLPGLLPFVVTMPPARRAAAHLALRAPAVAASLHHERGVKRLRTKGFLLPIIGSTDPTQASVNP